MTAPVRDYPPWLAGYDQRHRRFCRLCGSPVLSAPWISGTWSDFEPDSFGRYRFKGARFSLHVSCQPAPAKEMFESIERSHRGRQRKGWIIYGVSMALFGLASWVLPGILAVLVSIGAAVLAVLAILRYLAR